MVLKVVRIILSIVGLVLASYGLITKDYHLLPFMMLFLGGLMLVMALEELKKKRKSTIGYVLIVISLFVFFVSVQGFLLN